MDLTTLSLPELRELNCQVLAAAKALEADEVKRAREQVVQIAKALGIPLKKLLAGLVSGEKTKVSAKYRNPANLRRSGLDGAARRSGLRPWPIKAGSKRP